MVDTERCAGHAQCAALCPSVFDSDEFGYAVVRADGEVPREKQELVEVAIAACPEQAISWVESSIREWRKTG